MREAREETDNYFRRLAIVVSVSFVTSLGILCAVPWMATASRRILPFIWLRVVLGAFAVMALGFVLFVFRLMRRNLYGCAEMGFAIATAAVSIWKLQSYGDVSSWVGVGAAVYLVVRGIDNAMYKLDHALASG